MAKKNKKSKKKEKNIFYPFDYSKDNFFFGLQPIIKVF